MLMCYCSKYKTMSSKEVVQINMLQKTLHYYAVDVVFKNKERMVEFWRLLCIVHLNNIIIIHSFFLRWINKSKTRILHPEIFTLDLL